MKYNLSLFSALLLAFGIAQADDLRQHIDIPAQALSSALDNLAKQTKLQMLFDRQVLVGKQSSGLSGDYTGVDAARELLAGSGLIVEKTGDNAVSIRQAAPGAPQSATTLKPVTVTGKANRDVTDPYNQDYVLPNATAGTKTDTPIMETPLNVQVVSKQVLKDQQVIDLSDALKNVSGVTTGSFAYGTGNNGAPQQQITLRGFASQTFFRNGFRLTEGSASRDMSNVESVEVLKGPAAILYGLSEPGGMVNVVTKQPLATPYYAVNQQFGSYNTYRTTVDATGPVASNKDVLYRMNMSYQNSGSFRDLVSNENVFLAPVLKWNISPKTQATVEMEYQHKNFTADTGFLPIVNGQLLNVPINTNYGSYSPGAQDTFFGGLNWSHQFNDDWGIKHRLSLNQVDSNVPLSSYPSYQLSDPRASGFFKGIFPNINIDPNAVYQLEYSNTKNNNNTYSTNIDLTGHFDTVGLKHTLLLGGDYYRLNYSNSSANNFASFPGWWFGGAQPPNVNLYNPTQPPNNYPPVIDPTSWAKSVTNTDQYGFYVQDQIKLPHDVHVMGGIRYQNIHQKSLTQDYLGMNTLNPSQSQDAVTPRVGILWQPQKWLSTYANYVEGFGANTGRTWPGNQSVAPTSASQYEGGIKTEFFGGRLRANFAYYDLTKTNVVSTDPDPTHICGGGQCSLAIGAVRSRGPELDIQGEILPGWNAIATYANTSINVTKTDAQNSAFLGLYPVGSRYWGVPRNTASVFSTYEFQKDTLKGLKVGGGVNMQDGQTACCTTASVSQIPGFATVDLLAGYSLHVGKTKVTAQLNVKNLLDKYYVLGGGIDPLGNGTPTGMFSTFGQPRMFMGSIGIQF